MIMQPSQPPTFFTGKTESSQILAKQPLHSSCLRRPCPTIPFYTSWQCLAHSLGSFSVRDSKATELKEEESGRDRGNQIMSVPTAPGPPMSHKSRTKPAVSIFPGKECL